MVAVLVEVDTAGRTATNWVAAGELKKKVVVVKEGESVWGKAALFHSRAYERN